MTEHHGDDRGARYGFIGRPRRGFQPPSKSACWAADSPRTDGSADGADTRDFQTSASAERLVIAPLLQQIAQVVQGVGVPGLGSLAIQIYVNVMDEVHRDAVERLDFLVAEEADE